MMQPLLYLNATPSDGMASVTVMMLGSSWQVEAKSSDQTPGTAGETQNASRCPQTKIEKYTYILVAICYYVYIHIYIYIYIYPKVVDMYI